MPRTPQWEGEHEKIAWSLLDLSGILGRITLAAGSLEGHGSCAVLGPSFKPQASRMAAPV